MLDLLGGGGQVLSVSIDDAWAPAVRAHPRITTFPGSSTDPEIVREVVRRVTEGSGGCLVNLDSDHRRDHVLAELRAYADLPGPGDYLIVEDGNVNGHPVRPDHGPGPYEAVEAFLASDSRYVVDSALEQRYLVTFAVKGFLRRRHRSP
jgi:cephalosporin hydroxylase